MTGAILIGTPGSSTSMLFNALDPEFAFDRVLIEDPVSPLTLVRRRLRRLGPVTVAGQLFFLLGLRPLLRLASRRRRAEIARLARLDGTSIDSRRVDRVPSMNEPGTAELIAGLQPRVVLVSGTRLLSRALLDCVQAPFINVHAGVTPLYRGVHGAYWALAQRDPEHCGVSVHLVDAGMDTGAVLAWTRITPGPTDDFTTYPLLQLSAALPLVREQMRLALTAPPQPIAAPAGISRSWSHPTLWGYLWRRACHGVR